MTQNRADAPRRNNAPMFPRKPATTVPDLLFALAAAGATMAVIFFVASFYDNDVTAGEAGKFLARIFAAALLASAFFLSLIGMGLMRDDRGQADHYVVPIIIGVIIGILESFLFLLPAEDFLWAPFVLLIFVFRPVRKHLARMVNPGQR